MKHSCISASLVLYGVYSHEKLDIVQKLFERYSYFDKRGI